MPEEIKQMEVEDRRLEVRSEAVQDILARVPNLFIRIGITIIFFILLLLLAGTWFIKYPDLLTSQVILTTQTPPARLVARASGKLEHLFVRENERVTKGDYLASIQSAADINDVFTLKRQLEKFSLLLEKPELYKSIAIDTILSLGELQGDHSNFLKAYFENIDFYDNNYFAEKIDAIQNQINNYYVLNEKLIYQKKILADEFGVNENLFDKDKKLYANKVVSETEFLTKQSVYLQKKYSFENVTVSIINNNIQLWEYKKAILDLKQQEQDTKRNLMASIRDSYRRLLSQIAVWEQSYILTSPIAGEVSFFKYWSENQYVNINDEIMTVVGDSANLIGKILLPAIGSGKVKVGQDVRIKFDDYPYNEYGVVKGKVVSISKIPRNNQYVVNVELINGLTTTYRKQLEYNQEMQGTAEIVTEDLRLFQRIFNQIRKLLDRISK